jgi:hypothetical protein
VEDKIEYFEDLCKLDLICPHTDALECDGTKIYYRAIKGELSSDSFLPTPLDDSRPLPKAFDECIAKSVSVFDDLQGLINAVYRLPFNRGKKKTIGILKLAPTDGKIKQTFDNKSHHSWWRSKTFNITTVTKQDVEA